MAVQLPLQTNSPLVAGIGSALVDILLQESNEFVAASGAAKGGMTLVECPVIERMLATTMVKPAIVSGGSAGNTIVGIGNLGGPARFIGKMGKDELGKKYHEDLKRNNVEPILFMSDSPTGRVLSVITPDAQRTMFTYLGAASEMKPGDVSVEQLQGAAIVHIEGYLLFNEDLMYTALKAAKASNALVSLDLASFTVVEAKKALISELIRDYVDIVIANEDEARAYTGIADEEKSLAALARQASIAVVKIGKRGSMISYGNVLTRIPLSGPQSAVDTTGAGDLWAAGFLYGIAHGFSIEKAGKLGSACGGEVCQVIGAHIPEEGWARIRGLRQVSSD